MRLVAVDRVARAPAGPSTFASALLLFGETVLKTMYGLRRRGLAEVEVGVLRGDQRRAAATAAGRCRTPCRRVGVPVCSCCWIESWLTGLVDHDLVDVRLADRVGRRRPRRGCARRRSTWSAVHDSTLYGPSEIWCWPSSVLAGRYLSTSIGRRRERRQGEHVDEVRGRLGQLEHDRAVVLGDDAGQAVSSMYLRDRGRRPWRRPWRTRRRTSGSPTIRVAKSGMPPNGWTGLQVRLTPRTMSARGHLAGRRGVPLAPSRILIV